MSCQAPHHGTKYAYKRYKCRCPGAVAAIRADRATTRARRPHGATTWRGHRDVDAAAVYLAIRGEPLASGGRPRLGITERRIAIQELTRKGYSIVQICDRLGVSHHTVSNARRRCAA